MKNQDVRIEVLDGLRALAILLVILYHSVTAVPAGARSELMKNWLFVFFHNGWCGVDLFFVLSGFLITHQLLHSSLENDSTRRSALLYYLKKRYFRIAPAYYLVLPVYLAIKVAGSDSEQHWVRVYLYHLLFMQDYSGRESLGLLWSLAIEAKFYLFAPLLVLLILRIGNIPMRFAALGVLLLLSPLLRVLSIWFCLDPFIDFTNYFFELRNRFHLMTDGLMAGTLCAFLWNDERIRGFLKLKTVANGLFVTGLIILLALTGRNILLLSPVTLFEKTLMVFVFASAFSFMLLGLLGGCTGHRLFTSPVPRFIARVSYSLYLIHILVLPLQFYISEHVAFDSLVLSWMVGFASFLGITLCCAWLMYTFVEKPFNDWSRRTTVLSAYTSGKPSA